MGKKGSKGGHVEVAAKKLSSGKPHIDYMRPRCVELAALVAEGYSLGYTPTELHGWKCGHLRVDGMDASAAVWM
jgi:hypothetical protein